MIRTGGAAFDPDAPRCYFYASNPHTLRQAFLRLGSPKDHHVLVAVNDLENKSARAELELLIEDGCKVFLDSGVFWLTNRHKKEHGLTMDQALGLAPTDIDGFDWLWDKYLELVTSYADDLWGYVELDQGGAVNKRITRAKLHDLGLNPIPVYHPLVDGWDYFDELAEGYDRLCFGNVVQADSPTRTKLLATAYERHRQYPDLWVHLLGYTPDQRLLAFPTAAESCDSSSWLTGMRWSKAWREKAMGRTFAGGMEPEMVYPIGDTEARADMLAVASLQFEASVRTWNEWPQLVADEAAVELLPEPLEAS